MSAQQAKAMVAALDGHIFRRVDGKIHNFFQSGRAVCGWVRYVDGDVVIIQMGDKYQAIKNYNGLPATDGKQIRASAIRNGVFIWDTKPLELWDCGTILPPEEERQQEQAMREKIAADEKVKADAIAVKREQQRQKTYLVQSNAVFHLQALATNGDVSAQSSLGAHYLKGEGCETNQALAVKWLTMAADNGGIEASNRLERLKASPPTH